MPRSIIFGEIEGIEEGQLFEGRKEMMATSFHRNWGAGIDGNGKEGTAAIVLSGGYEDDKDLGDEIIYTGAGGNDPSSRKQIADQSWENRGNAGLLKSMDEGLPVRVIRGYKHKSKYSPSTGYSYAGLFSVVDAWEEKGQSGFKICRFRLVYSGENTSRKTAEQIELDHSIKEKKRRADTVLRVHIKPLGKPHNGDDSIANLLCLCPNHHVMFDKGTFAILDDLNLIGEENGFIHVDEKHKIDVKNLSYHRESHGFE